MMEVENNFTTETILEKIPAEKGLEITAKFLVGFSILRGSKTMPPVLGKEEGFISPIRGWEKWEEINTKVLLEGARKLFPMFKEMFNIPVEDALGAAKLGIVVAEFLCGPEQEYELLETTKERSIDRTTRCAYMERYKELEIDPELIVCPSACQEMYEAGIKAVNPKITFKLMKQMPRGDPYCEFFYELNE